MVDHHRAAPCEPPDRPQPAFTRDSDVDQSFRLAAEPQYNPRLRHAAVEQAPAVHVGLRSDARDLARILSSPIPRINAE